MNANIRRVSTLDLRFEPWDWPFARERRVDIDAHFAKLKSDKPSLWNGQVLLGRAPRFDGDTFRASYFQTDFASFIAWRDWGFPDREVFNGFGMGALRSSDGAFLLGEMAADTANAGKVYFPSGTPEPADLAGDVLDIAASVAREVEEETGLSPSDYRAEPAWTCAQSGTLIAMMRVLHVDAPAAALRDRILRNLAAQKRPELSDIHIVGDMADATPAMPSFITAFLDNALQPNGAIA